MPMMRQDLRRIAYDSLLELATNQGINASGKEEIYGCIFGRDSAITVLKILKSISKDPDPKLSAICRRALLKLISLQGKTVNIESGEAPGKFIHEYRTDRFEHLTNLSPPKKPWYLYPDHTIRNYDSIDSTPLMLIAIYYYWRTHKNHDRQFLITVLPAVEAGLNWVISCGDLDKDCLLEYELPNQRRYGGLLVQSWTDSDESLKTASGHFPQYPIAPVEVQGYAWLALKLWGTFYKAHSPAFSQKLLSQADRTKSRFNEAFIIRDNELYFAAQALDGAKHPINTITGNPLLLLWATYFNGYERECVLADKFIGDFVRRSFMDDLFDPDAGIRTMSSTSPTFNPTETSYHNGSFWPVLNGMIYEGLLNWGYRRQALQLREAALKPLEYFGSPIELYVKLPQGQYSQFRLPSGQTSCRVQAWTAAAMLDMLTDARLSRKLIQTVTLLGQLPLRYLLKPVRLLGLR